MSSLLDQRVLEERRFLLVRDDEGLEIAHLAIEPLDEEARVAAAGREVAPHAAAERASLTDVEDVPLPIEEHVHARGRRQRVELRDDEIGKGHGETLASAVAPRSVPERDVAANQTYRGVS